MNDLTWAVLIKLEPRLMQVFDDCRAVKDDHTKSSFCANDVWYRQFKPRIVQLVGWERDIGDTVNELGTARAYEIAYQTCYDQLPDCRDCMCM